MNKPTIKLFRYCETFADNSIHLQYPTLIQYI